LYKRGERFIDENGVEFEVISVSVIEQEDGSTSVSMHAVPVTDIPKE